MGLCRYLSKIEIPFSLFSKQKTRDLKNLTLLKSLTLPTDSQPQLWCKSSDQVFSGLKLPNMLSVNVSLESTSSYKDVDFNPTKKIHWSN